MKKGRSLAERWDALLAAYALPKPPSEAEREAAWAHFNALNLDPDGLEYLHERARLLCRGEEDRLLVGFIQALVRGDVTHRRYEEALAVLHTWRRAQYRCRRATVRPRHRTAVRRPG